VSVIGICSVKGAPGVTTLATALAAHGQSAGVVLIEADAAGGDLALKFGIGQNPGLAQLAARARHPAPGRDVLDGLTSQVASQAFDLVPAPVEPAAVAAALGALAASPDVLVAAGRRRPLILDLGRIDLRSPGFALVESCDVLCVVVRGDLASLGHAREATWLAETPGRSGFVLVDTGPYRAHEAADALTLLHLGTVPFSRRPLSGRRGARAVGAVWDALRATNPEPVTAPEPVRVSTR
jgi:hypothetical protein